MSTDTGVRADEVAGVVRDALALVLELDPPSITADAALADLGADSLALVEVAEVVEERLSPLVPGGLYIPDCDLAALRRVGDLVDYAAARVRA